jgi:hypothetical protein
VYVFITGLAPVALIGTYCTCETNEVIKMDYQIAFFSAEKFVLLKHYVIFASSEIL